MAARADLFRQTADVLLRQSGCTVGRVRRNMTGLAYTGSDDWRIEAPDPRGPVSFGVFAHEIAHHMLHRGSSKPRWLEEIEAWEWALEQFDRFALPGRENAERHAVRSLEYAARKAERRAKPETAERMRARYAWVFAAHRLEELRAEQSSRRKQRDRRR